ncbi:MAG TPA: MaoC/PaaZ C-terminal domain-containing protein [Polyangiaceae bacterium]|jgi:3-hydroxyacyl-CoA dehydrogenase/3a,7a,12a-trihydroxy-5b-cholest-24-enoyl-CoA hydratase|nr:MaoC/PaaZ C-terminal domain-containing protein [Polyangiaceae bacterium]
MPIDPKQALGAKLESIESSWNEDKLILYALGIGVGLGVSQVDPRRVLQYTYENGLKAMPTYGVIPMFSAVGGLFNIPGLSFNPMMLLHGEQYTEILSPPLPTSADIVTEGTVSGIYDKGKGALVTIDFVTSDKRTKKPLLKNVMSAFIRGEGGFGGDAKSPEPGNVPPDRQPDIVVESPTQSSQALLYRLSGDKNPLHVDPMMAKMGGFDVPILHGLCTFGYLGRAVIETCTDDQPERFKSIQVRFSKPVFPGETIVSQLWKVSPNEIICKARVKERDTDVITNAKVTLTG